MKKINVGKTVEKLYIWVVGTIAAVISLFLAMTSLLHTTFVETINQSQSVDSILYRIRTGAESVIYRNDNFIFNIISLAVIMLVVSVMLKFMQKCKLKYNICFIAVWTIILGTVWVMSSQSAPTCDSKTVVSASMSFAHGDLSFLANGRYLKDYSYQLGYVLFNEVIIRFVELFMTIKNFLFLEILNVIFLAVINVFVILINNEIFDDSRVNNATTLIVAASVAPIISCTFVYGIIPGMMFAVVALYFEIKYIKTEKKLFAVISLFMVSIAVVVKPNYSIWVIAMAIICFVAMVKKKKYILNIAFILLIAVMPMLSQRAVKSFYEYRSGAKLGDAIPYSSWISMGLQENGMAPGWFSVTPTVDNFKNSGYNADKASEVSKNEIKQRVNYFIYNQRYASDFFYYKAVSQWNETTYESLWNNTVRDQYQPKGRIAAFFCYRGERITKLYMDCVAQYIFVMFFVGIVLTLKKKRYESLTFPLIIIGGFAYHMLSEGKSQYILPYFILMTAFAAYGAVAVNEEYISGHILFCNKKSKV